MIIDEQKSRLEHINVCTIGHVDHGKTTLSSAISHLMHSYDPVRNKASSYADIDNAPEEKARGVTINASTIDFIYKEKYYTLRDLPGHKQYMKNMMTGVVGVDIALLIVDAEEGLKPQTTTHLAVCKRLKINNLIVCINKIDKIEDPTEREDAIAITKEMVLETLIEMKWENTENIPFVSVSGLQSLNGSKEYQDKIITLLDTISDMHAVRNNPNEDLLISISRTFSIPGRGTVVAGNVSRGTLKVGDTISIKGMGLLPVSTVVTGIEMMHKSIDKALPGDDVGVLIRSVKQGELSRGMLLTIVGQKSADIFTAKQFTIPEFYVMSFSEGGRLSSLKEGERIRFSFNNATITGTIDKILSENNGMNFLEPGEIGKVWVKIEFEHAFQKGTNVCCIEGQYVIGGGMIDEL